MRILKKTSLFQIIAESIAECGWQYELFEEHSNHPFVLRVFNKTESYNLRIYVWNLSHGGRGKRPKHEYRIQVTGINRFERARNEKSLILGWWDELQVFAGFDYSKHTSKLGFSASMQISEDTLLKAHNAGLATQEKTNGEVAVAFTPDNFTKYVAQLEYFHSIDDFEIIDETEKEVITYRYAISSYGADYPVDAIVKRIEGDNIHVPPYQRNYIWDITRASKFIESLILGLPVPGVFLSREKETNKLLIIDGQQRLLSLHAFVTGFFKEKPFRLKGVQPDLEDKLYAELNASDKLRLDDSIIHATVVKQDEPDDQNSSLYMIYERLNTGGKLLNAQEIRASIYYGSFNELLNSLVGDPEWRAIFGKPDERMKENEMILRFFALYFEHRNYQKPLKLFLNGFMSKNRNLEKYSAQILETTFLTAIQFVNESLHGDAFKLTKGINAAIFDSVMVGVAKRLQKGIIKNKSGFAEAYYRLINDHTFAAYTREGTSDDLTVKARISLAINAFEKLL